MSLEVGGEATVSLDALDGYSFPAKITQIAPVATTSQGVVNYKVTIELTSTKPVSAVPGMQSSGIPGAPPSGFTPPPGFTPPANFTPPTGSIPPGDTPSLASSTPKNITLKDGLSATVNILIQKKDNILMVPSRAISHQGGNATVQLVKGSGTEIQKIQTGITDGTNTEIISGLKESDQVLMQIKISSGNQFFLGPGGGGPPPPGGIMP
jgi:multidrug efflux pump subunit AcrA (membrane-fusion protein)